MEETKLEIARKHLQIRTKRAEAILFKFYNEIVDRRRNASMNGNGDAEWGWELLHNGETPSVLAAAGVVLKTYRIFDLFILRYCPDCHMIYLDNSEESLRKYRSLSYKGKKALLSACHAINGVVSPPIVIPTLIDNGIELSGGMCYYCGRIGLWGEQIRKIQRKEVPWDCYGTSFDFCSEMERCDYQIWNCDEWTSPEKRKIIPLKAKCVISRDFLALEGRWFWNKLGNYWNWALRADSLSRIEGEYRFKPQIRRASIDG